MNVTTYEDLSLQLREPLKNCRLIYSVYDVENDDFFQLNLSNDTEDTMKQFTIVVDDKFMDSPINYPSTYYCNSIKELKEIILYTNEHEDLYFSSLEDSGFETLE